MLSLRKKILRHNDGPFMTKELGKEIMKDLNSKISVTKTKIMKTGPFIKEKEITVYHC